MKPERFAQRFRQRVVRQYFVRFHMSLILAATTAVAVIASKLMLMAGLGTVLWRYPLALAAAYLAFLGLTRLWVSYVLIAAPRRGSLSVLDHINLDLPDVSLPSRPVDAPLSFGGGDSGGGGASSFWEGGGSPTATLESGGGSWIPEFDLDLGEGIGMLIALAALVVAVLGSGLYLIYAAPTILPDVALNALLASCLTRAARRAEMQGWVVSVWRSTRIPLLLILVFTVGLAYAIQHYCPGAAKLAEALSCPDAP